VAAHYKLKYSVTAEIQRASHREGVATPDGVPHPISRVPLPDILSEALILAANERE